MKKITALILAAVLVLSGCAQQPSEEFIASIAQSAAQSAVESMLAEEAASEADTTTPAVTTADTTKTPETTAATTAMTKATTTAKATTTTAKTTAKTTKATTTTAPAPEEIMSESKWKKDYWFDYEKVYGKNTVNSESKYAAYFSDKLGSVGEPENTTVIVSLFVEDKRMDWDLEKSHDRKIYDRIRKNLDISTEWIKKEFKEYGSTVDFVYDFEKYPDLRYDLKTTVDMQASNGELIDDKNGREVYLTDSVAWEFIEENIDPIEIMRAYKAQNIVFCLYMDTLRDNTAVTCSRKMYSNMPYPFELCFFYMNGVDGDYDTPGAFAHELLHTFGAVDLYMASDYPPAITQEYVDSKKWTLFEDIMYTLTDNFWGDHDERIEVELTDITAYYIGLTDKCDDVTTYGLGKTEHIKH